jgi:hypothetical protein
MCPFEESTVMTVLLESKDEQESTWQIEMCREASMVVSSACHVVVVECQQRKSKSTYPA